MESPSRVSNDVRVRNRLGAPPGEAAVIDFCATCTFAAVCALAGYGKPELSQLHYLVEHLGPFDAGERIFRAGVPFDALFAVRSGAVKTIRTDTKGRERVLGFFLPGEAVGLSGIYPEYYPCDAVALERTTVCRFSFDSVSALAQYQPRVQRHLFRMLSKELGSANAQAGYYSGTQRMAAFLVDLGDRYAARGLSCTRFRFNMAHTDIASYLSLAAETVSRVLRTFREQGLIKLDRRGHEIELLDRRRLKRLVGVPDYAGCAQAAR